MSDQRVAEIERLLEEAEQLPDPRARGLAKALAAALVELTGAGLARIVELEPALLRAMADDPLVGNLLVLCNLHPDPPAVRAERALAAATRELGSVDVVVDGVDLVGDNLRVRVSPAKGVPSGAIADRVRGVVESIVLARVPDVGGIIVELAGAQLMPAGFVPIDRLRVIT